MDYIDIVVAQDNINIDRARLRFGEGVGMEKFDLSNDHSQLCFWQNGQDYAVTYVNGESELPLNFKAKQNGTHTLSIKKNLDLDNLLLIDNLTGIETNLLETPSYSFEARTSDYASRFKIVLKPVKASEITSEESFGFIANEKFHLVEDQGLLQVIDLNGKILLSESHANQLNLGELCDGVYIIRWIKTESVRVQKILIE
jgi:hypothetical protein